jgi:hypothetical protein
LAGKRFKELMVIPKEERIFETGFCGQSMAAFLAQNSHFSLVKFLDI